MQVLDLFHFLKILVITCKNAHKSQGTPVNDKSCHPYFCVTMGLRVGHGSQGHLTVRAIPLLRNRHKSPSSFQEGIVKERHKDRQQWLLLIDELLG